MDAPEDLEDPNSPPSKLIQDFSACAGLEKWNDSIIFGPPGGLKETKDPVQLSLFYQGYHIIGW
jgi:hypothetical protein